MEDLHELLIGKCESERQKKADAERAKLACKAYASNEAAVRGLINVCLIYFYTPLSAMSILYNIPPLYCMLTFVLLFYTGHGVNGTLQAS